MAQLDSTPLLASNAKRNTNNHTIFIPFFFFFTFCVWKSAQPLAGVWLKEPAY